MVDISESRKWIEIEVDLNVARTVQQVMLPVLESIINLMEELQVRVNEAEHRLALPEG